MDHAIDIDWLIYEDSFITNSEKNNSFIDQNLWLNIKPPYSLFDQVKFFLQLKNPLSVLVSYFQGISPFWRAPPVFHPSFS